MKTMFTLTLAAGVLAFSACGPADADTTAPDQTAKPASESAEPADPAASAEAAVGYDALLRAHVGPLGFVDYDALAADPAALSAYVRSLAAPDLLDGLDGLDNDAKLAALINAYNAFTLQLIVQNYGGGAASGGLKSITDLHGGKPWDQKIWDLAGQTVSLNQIEHEMIRKEFPGEPRIHWAVVCAAYSCPPLRAEAYTAKGLEEQLADQERRVLLAGDKRFLDASGPAIRVTKLFEWYGHDFGDDWRTYVTQRLKPEEAKYGGFLDYDWRLNAMKNRP